MSNTYQLRHGNTVTVGDKYIAVVLADPSVEGFTAYMNRYHAILRSHVTEERGNAAEVEAQIKKSDERMAEMFDYGTIMYSKHQTVAAAKKAAAKVNQGSDVRYENARVVTIEDQNQRDFVDHLRTKEGS